LIFKDHNSYWCLQTVMALAVIWVFCFGQINYFSVVKTSQFVLSIIRLIINRFNQGNTRAGDSGRSSPVYASYEKIRSHECVTLLLKLLHHNCIIINVVYHAVYDNYNITVHSLLRPTKKNIRSIYGCYPE
jgi:hypothetical protein